MKDISDQLKEQFSANGTIYVIVGATLVALGLAFHNGATATLVPIGILFIFVGSRLSHLKTKEEEQKTMEAEKAKKKALKEKLKTHEMFYCPKCKASCFVPRGKGKVRITCPKCGEKFIGKT